MLLSGGCAVQLSSPYSAGVAERAAKLHDDIISFELEMRRNSGTQSGDPRADANQRRFDGWQGSVETMEVISVHADPQVVDCRTILSRLQARGIALDSETTRTIAVASAASAPDGQDGAERRRADCQTAVVRQLAAGISTLRTAYERRCPVPGLEEAEFDDAARRRPVQPAVRVDLPDCNALFIPPPRAVRLGLAGPHGLGVDALLRTIRALLQIQEGKRP